MTDLEFQHLASEAVIAVGEKTVAERFSISLPAARRWASGDSAPHPAARARIGMALRALIREGSKR